MPAIFGRPETGGVEFAPAPDKPAPRLVHVTGYVLVEVEVDVWVDADEDMDDEEIRRAALEDANVSGEIESVHLDIEDDDRKKNIQTFLEQRQRENRMLEAWLGGEPIR